MIPCTDGFKKAIKTNMRECKAKVVLGYSTPLTLEDNKIQSINITSKADIALGDVQNDDIVLTLMPKVLTDAQFNQTIDVTLYIGCVVDEATEYISVGTFLADGWGKNDKTGMVTINLTNKIDNDMEIPQNIIAKADTDIRDYAKDFVSSVYGKTLDVQEDVPKQILDKSWLYYNNAIDQLKAFAVACNGLFRYANDFELVAYKPKPSSDTLKQGACESIMFISRISDYSKNKNNACILKSRFAESDICKLASTTITSPLAKNETDSTKSHIELKTGCPIDIVYVCIGNEYGRFDKIIPKIVTCSVAVDDGYGKGGHKIPVSVYGRKIESALVDKKDENSPSNITYIQNPYIQTDDHVNTLNKAIYKGVRYKVQYRGNPCYQVGDVLTIDGLGDILVYSHILTYNGGLNGYLEGVLVDAK